MSGKKAVMCDQALYTWAHQNLTGSGGFGLLARSAGWSGRIEDLVPRLFSFLPQGSAVRRGDSPPRALSCSRTAEGVVVARKTYLGATGDGRQGNYLVHALVDVSFTLTPRDVAALWSSDLPYWEVPPGAVPTEALEPLSLSRKAGRPRRPRSDVAEAYLAALVALYLAGLRAGRPVVLLCSDSDCAAELLLHLYLALPAGLTADSSFTTYEARPVQLSHQVSVVHPGFTEGAVHYTALQMDLDRPVEPHGDVTEAEWGDARLLADTYLDGGELVPDSVATAELLARHLDVHRTLQMGPENLTVTQMEELLRTVPGWLAAPSSRAALLEVLDSATPQLVDRLVDHRQTEGFTRLVEDATQRLVATMLNGDDFTALENALLQMEVSPDHLNTLLGRQLLQVLRQNGLTPHQAHRGWDYLVSSMDEMNVGDISALLELPGMEDRLVNEILWTNGHAYALEEYLNRRDQRRRYGLLVQRGVERHIDHMAASLDYLIGAQRVAVEGMCEALLEVVTPEELVRLLLLLHSTPPGYLLRAIDSLPQVKAHRVLELYWATVARHEGLTQLGRLLTPVEPPAASASAANLLPSWGKRKVALWRRD